MKRFVTYGGVLCCTALLVTGCDEQQYPFESEFQQDPIEQFTPQMTHLPGHIIIKQVDDGGSNDQPGQKDLTRLDSDFGIFNVSPEIDVSWNWDAVVGFSGNNTGDACALFDTNANGLVNYALCVTIIEDANGVLHQLWDDLNGNGLLDMGEPFDSPRLYICDESPASVANRRCTSSVLLNDADPSSQEDPDPSLLSSTCSVTSPSGDDPFPDGDAQPNDTKASCIFSFADMMLPGAGGESSATLLNVCSYPSQVPNSDPSDCVVTPGTAFLIIKKNVGSDPDATFDFTLSPAANDGKDMESITTSGGTGQSGLFLVDAETLYSLTESIPMFWELNSATCVGGTSNGTFNMVDAITGIQPSSGQVTTCTFVNARTPPPTIAVVKTSNETFTRTWSWTILKELYAAAGPAGDFCSVLGDAVAEGATLDLQLAETFVGCYKVSVDPSSSDTEILASGQITVTATGSTDFVSTSFSVSDVLDGMDITPVCDNTQLQPGTPVNCTWSQSFPDDAVPTTVLTNTATVDVTWNSGDTDMQSGQVDVDFSGGPTTELHETIDVDDTFAGALGSATRAMDMFVYQRDLTCATVGLTNYPNTASFASTEAMPATGSDDFDVNVNCLPIGDACTLTQGYWKTHSSFGPAPLDETWAGMENDLFLGSGQTWYEVFWTPPQGGNAWYILAHQYMAAVLNGMGGADTGVVAAELAEALALLEEYDADGPSTNGRNLIPRRSDDRSRAIELAGILGSYNEGELGVPHCDVDGLTAST